jgi:hypothetical protein
VTKSGKYAWKQAFNSKVRTARVTTSTPFSIFPRPRKFAMPVAKDVVSSVVVLGDGQLERDNTTQSKQLWAEVQAGWPAPLDFPRALSLVDYSIFPEVIQISRTLDLPARKITMQDKAIGEGLQFRKNPIESSTCAASHSQENPLRFPAHVREIHFVRGRGCCGGGKGGRSCRAAGGAGMTKQWFACITGWMIHIRRCCRSAFGSGILRTTLTRHN